MVTAVPNGPVIGESAWSAVTPRVRGATIHAQRFLRHGDRFACRDVLGEVIDPVIGWRRGKCSAVQRWRAVRAAAMLDDVVDAQLPLVAGLGEQSRHRVANNLAELVMLAHAYRRYAEGWIDRQELDRRGRAVIARLTATRPAHPAATA